MKIHMFMNRKEAVCEHGYCMMDRDEERCSTRIEEVNCRTCREILKKGPLAPPLDGSYVRVTRADSTE